MKNSDRTLFIIISCFFLLKQSKVVAANTPDNVDEYSIITNLTTGYNSLIRPKDVLDLSFKLNFKQINNIDEKNQILTSNSYFSATWEDSRLAWDPSDYGGLDNVLIPSSKLWMPDLFIINTASTSGYVTIPTSQLTRVDSLGLVYVVFYLSSQQTRCQLDLFYFPFDTQICQIIIGIHKFIFYLVLLLKNYCWNNSKRLLDVGQYQIK